MIERFEGEYSFLSNFAPSPLTFYHPTLGECDALNVEMAYQACKTDVKEEILDILVAPTPGRAKRLGRKATMRTNWHDVRLLNMGILVRLKFTQNPKLAERLLATGEETLIEGNWWHDNFWGVCDCRGCFGGSMGQNNLGKLLMDVRKELQNA